MSCSFPLGLSEPVNGLSWAEIDLKRGMKRAPCDNSRGLPPSLLTGFHFPILSARGPLDGATWVRAPASVSRPPSLGSGLFLFQAPRLAGLKGPRRVWGAQPPCRHPAVPSDCSGPTSPLLTPSRSPATSSPGGKWQSSLQGLRDGGFVPLLGQNEGLRM